MRQLFAEATGELMARAGQTLLNVIGVTPSAESVNALMAQEQIEGLIYFTFGPAQMGYAGLHGNVAYISGKPVVGARLSLWGDASTGDKVSSCIQVCSLYSVVVNSMRSHVLCSVSRASGGCGRLCEAA
jgi:hypothetical protein